MRTTYRNLKHVLLGVVIALIVPVLAASSYNYFAPGGALSCVSPCTAQNVDLTQTANVSGPLRVGAGGTGVNTLTGLAKGNATSAFTAATASDITSLAAANPTGLIGLTANNGIASTLTRSDATHALDPSISPTWTGSHLFQQQVTGTDQATGAFLVGSPVAGANGIAFHSGEVITAHAHYAFVDDSTITMASGGAGVGHASFDSNPTVNGTVSFDHHHDYQAVAHYSLSGTISEGAAYWAQPQITSGTLTDLALVRGLNPVSSGGTITTLYGLYLQGLTAGATNWGVYVDGNTPSALTGGVILSGARPTLDRTKSQASCGADTGGTAQCTLIDSANPADQKAWDQIVDGTSCTSLRAVNDANSVARNWLQTCRGTGVAVASIALGNSTDNPTLSVNTVDLTPVTSTFTATYTGMTVATTCTATFSRIGKLVVLTFCIASGTSNTTTLTMSGLPASIRPPALTQFIAVPGSETQDNTVLLTTTQVMVSITNSSTVTFYKAGGANSWTAAGTKGVLSNLSVTYQLN